MDRNLLETPFASEQIRTRRGFHGETLDYVPAHIVIQRLNDAFEGEWSFEVLRHEVNENDVTVIGCLSIDGVVKSQFGSSRISRSREEGTAVSLGDDLKAAATDALKKCATLFGVGLYLYGDDPDPGERADKPAPQARPASAAQLRAIYAIGESRGLDEAGVRAMCLEGFGLEPEDLSLPEASRFIQELKSMERPRRTA